MVSQNEDALVCDLAETYRIYDWRSLPARVVARLAAGLREDSRIITELSGQSVRVPIMLQAMMVDGIHMVAWLLSDDGKHGRNRPESVLAALTEKKSGKDDVIGFESPDAFEEARRRILGGV